MSPPESPNGKISTFSRVLAWIILACGLLAVIGSVLVAIKTAQKSDWLNAAMALVPLGVVVVLFWVPAYKGRSPRWMTSFETMYDREAERRGVSSSTSSTGRGVMFISNSVVFGLVLAVFGKTIGVFDGETGWFGAAVFFTAWLIVVLILWRNYRKQAAGSRDES
jgi:membrane protein YdbS with pleckstrin-like domain